MQTIEKKDIRILTLAELQEFFLSHGDKPFRAKQVWEWLWKKNARSFEEMSNLSFATRQFLKEQFEILIPQASSVLISKDKTIKTAFRFKDHALAEGVLIPAENRMTACVSTQIGCAMGCKFCATGKIGFVRNLSFIEIFDQITMIGRQAKENYNQHLTNIVFMGMGEPLLNYANLLKAIERVTAADGLLMSPSRLTVSTVGLPKMIKQLGDDQVKFNLAISLHAANDKKRNEIIPVNEQNSISKIIDALKYYYAKTENRITFEYLIMDRFNDTLADAKELAEFCKNFPCKVNIIEYNQVDGTGFRKSSETNVKAFAGFLEARNMIVNVRRSRGEDIAAACGQLAGKSENKIKNEFVKSL